jgi:hypothetical protein
MKRLVLPADYEAMLARGQWDWISKLSEWRAFRHLFFPMSILREADPKDLRELHGMIEQVLADTKKKEDNNNTSA